MNQNQTPRAMDRNTSSSADAILFAADTASLYLPASSRLPLEKFVTTPEFTGLLSKYGLGHRLFLGTVTDLSRMEGATQATGNDLAFKPADVLLYVHRDPHHAPDDQDLLVVVGEIKAALEHWYEEQLRQEREEREEEHVAVNS